MKFEKTLVLGLLSTSLLLPAQAEHSENSEENLLVTASRTPLPRQQTAASYTVIDAEDIALKQAVYVSDLLREVPGVAISRSGGAGKLTELRLRGAESDQVLVLIDGVEANDPAQGARFDFANLLANDIERIEVIRGPQSALWGSDAMAGVINIITKSGSDTDNTQITGILEGGSFTTTQTGVGVSNRGSNYRFAFNSNYIRTDGTNVAEQGDEDDGYENVTLNLRGGVNPLDNLDLSLSVRHTDSETEFDPAPFPAFVPADGDNVTDSTQTYAQGRAKLDLLSGHWQHIFGISYTDTDNDNFSNGARSTSTEGEKFKLHYQTNVFFDTPAFADASHTLTFLVENEEEDFVQTGTATSFGDPNQQQEFTNTGFVAEYRVSLFEQLFLSGSVRHDDNDVFDDATTYRTGIAYNFVATGTTLRGNYGTAVKNPTFSDRFGFSPNTFIGNPNLKPEKSKGWEVGIDQALFDDRAKVSITYFNDRLEDEINGFSFDSTLGGFTAVNVDGESRREGVEFSFNAMLTDQLDLTGAYTYIHATEADRTTGIQVREIRRPRNIASLNGNYRFYNERANVNLGIDYHGEQTDRNFGTFPATVVSLDDYILVNLAGQYELDSRFTLFGRIENLLDEDYRDVFGFNTPGIAAYAGIRVNLDL